MGLDSSIYKPKAEISSYGQDYESFLGEELIYFRKFDALNSWVLQNCEKLKNWEIDGNKITREDLVKLKSELDEKKDDYFFDDDFKDKLTELQKFLDREIVNPSCEYYYYTWMN